MVSRLNMSIEYSCGKNALPIRKLASSPIPPVFVFISCKLFLIASTVTPANGDMVNAAINAGVSDKSIFAKEGDSGSCISTKANTYDIAESIEINTRVRLLYFFFFCFSIGFHNTLIRSEVILRSPACIKHAGLPVHIFFHPDFYCRCRNFILLAR